ncbi:MAG: hypothetical protein ABIE23_00055 [archaeon]
MKYSMNGSVSVSSIPLDAEKIHLPRPIKIKLLRELLEKRGIREISLSNSTMQRLSEKARKLIEEKGIVLVKDNSRGRALETDLEQILRINELRGDYKSIRAIERMTGIPKSTIHYLLNYAQRHKVRKKGKTIYLE